jgi:hypothetical protein
MKKILILVFCQLSLGFTDKIWYKVGREVSKEINTEYADMKQRVHWCPMI